LSSCTCVETGGQTSYPGVPTSDYFMAGLCAFTS